MKLFDYIFFRNAFFYANGYGNDEHKELVAILILSLFQFINIIALSGFIMPIREFLEFNLIFIIVLLYALIFFLNYLRYNKIITFSKLQERWDSERRNHRIINKILVIGYYLLTIFLFLYSLNFRTDLS